MDTLVINPYVFFIVIDVGFQRKDGKILLVKELRIVVSHQKIKYIYFSVLCKMTDLRNPVVV